jgi:Flp pilus assembly protein TadD
LTQALPYLEKAVELSPNDDTKLNNLGVGYFMQKRYSEALALFTKAAGRSTVRTLIPHDNLRRMTAATKDPSYNPTITYSVLIRP